MFGFCITHILNTGCAKIWKKKKIRRQKVNATAEKVTDIVRSEYSQKCEQYRYMSLKLRFLEAVLPVNPVRRPG